MEPCAAALGLFMLLQEASLNYPCSHEYDACGTIKRRSKIVHTIQVVRFKKDYEFIDGGLTAVILNVKRSAISSPLFPNTIFTMPADHVETWWVFPMNNQVDQSVIYVHCYVPALAHFHQS